MGGGGGLISLMKGQSNDLTHSSFYSSHCAKQSAICSASLTLKSQWEAGTDEGTDERRVKEQARREVRMDKGKRAVAVTFVPGR